MRHGESIANVTGEFSSHNHAQHPLTDNGRAQVAKLAEELAPISCSAMYSSPFLRARQTADILAARLGVSYTLADALREHDPGELEGLSGPEHWQRYLDLFAEWLYTQNLDARIPGGESFNEMRARFVPFIADLLERHNRPEGIILLVGHAGLYHSMLPLILTNVGYSFSSKHVLDNAAYVLAETQESGLVCLQWGQVLVSQQGAIAAPGGMPGRPGI